MKEHNKQKDLKRIDDIIDAYIGFNNMKEISEDQYFTFIKSYSGILYTIPKHPDLTFNEIIASSY